MIAVDTNAAEDAVFAALARRCGAEAVQRRRLDVGDVELRAHGSDRTLVVERKTWLDWGKSLRDGRYADQKARLLSEGEASTATVVYILEGHIRGWWGHTGPDRAQVANSQLEAAILKTTLRDQITVLRTKDTDHTCQVLGYLADQLRDGTLYAPTTTRYAAGPISKRRRDNQDPWQLMLMAMPGMSADKAAAVAAQYPNMGALATATSDELAEVRVAVEGKKARRLGPSLAQKLADVC